MSISDDAFKTNGWDWVKYRQHARDDEIAMLNAEEQALSSIPEDVVEAASREAFRVDDPGVPIARKRTWEAIPEGGRENYRKLARAALTAAAPHLMAARLVETVEELDALPEGVMVRTDAGFYMKEALRRGYSTWVTTNERYYFKTDDIPLPATVIYTPYRAAGAGE